MFLVSYEDHGYDTRNLVTASNMTVAKWYVSEKMKERGHSIVETEWETDELDRTIFSLGDAQYVIEALVHIS